MAAGPVSRNKASTAAATEHPLEAVTRNHLVGAGLTSWVSDRWKQRRSRPAAAPVAA